MSSDSDLCFLPAVEQKRLLEARDVSAVQLLEAQLAQTERANPCVNAIVTSTAELARSAALASDALGVLEGLTVGVKDLFLTQGVRTTFGSPIYADLRRACRAE
jgi:amidase